MNVHELHILSWHWVLARVSSQEVNILVPLLELLVLHLKALHVTFFLRLGWGFAVVAKASDLVNAQYHII